MESEIKIVSTILTEMLLMPGFTKQPSWISIWRPPRGPDFWTHEVYTFTNLCKTSSRPRLVATRSLGLFRRFFCNGSFLTIILRHLESVSATFRRQVFDKSPILSSTAPTRLRPADELSKMWRCHVGDTSKTCLKPAHDFWQLPLQQTFKIQRFFDCQKSARRRRGV